MPLLFEPAERFDHTSGPKQVSTHFLGFDKTSNWQMIPKGGSRHLILRNATDLTFEATPTAKVNLHPSIDPRNPRITDIWVDGISEGSCILRAKNRLGAIMGLLNLEVAVPRIVKTAFYRLVDSKRSGSSTLDDNTVKQLVERVRLIVWDQTNCMMEALPTSGGALLRDLQVFGKELSAPKTGAVDIEQNDPVDVSAELSINLASGAAFHVFFVWGLAGSKGKSTNGVTKGVKTLILDSLDAAKMPVTLAHEFVHFLSANPGLDVVNAGGHDPLKDDLMFDTAPHGINIRKVRQDKLFRTPAP